VLNHEKTYWGGGTRRRWVVSFTPRPLYPLYPLDGRLAGPRASLDTVEERKIPSSCRKSNLPNPGRPARGQSLTDWATSAQNYVLVYFIILETQGRDYKFLIILSDVFFSLISPVLYCRTVLTFKCYGWCVKTLFLSEFM